MSAGIRDRAFEAPIHVMQCADGAIRLLLPDGHSITLSPEATARSAMLLTRASARAGKTGRRSRRALKVPPCVQADVIAVDFIHHARL